MKRQMLKTLLFGSAFTISGVGLAFAIKVSQTPNSITAYEENAFQAGTIEETTVAEIIETIMETTTEVVSIEETKIPTTTLSVIEETTTIPETIEEPIMVVETVTNVTYSDGNNTYHFDTLSDAEAALNTPVLSDGVAQAIAAENTSRYVDMISLLFSLVNEYRINSGLYPVTFSAELTQAACHRAVESAYSNWNMTAYENGIMHHYRPNFQQASSIYSYYGIGGNFGENYGRYFNTCGDVFGGWQNSTAHNSLLLTSDFSTVGVGIAQDSEGYYYFILLFN